jgi:hypothetical protein
MIRGIAFIFVTLLVTGTFLFGAPGDNSSFRQSPASVFTVAPASRALTSTARAKKTVTPTATPEETTTLYRAIDEVELAYVLTHGNYGFSTNGSGKYFALTLEGVVIFAKSSLNVNRQMTITSVIVPSKILERGYVFDDVGGARLSVHFSDAVLAELYREMSSITIVPMPVDTNGK